MNETILTVCNSVKRMLSLIFYAEFYWKLVLQFSCTLRCNNNLIVHQIGIKPLSVWVTNGWSDVPSPGRHFFISME